MNVVPQVIARLQQCSAPTWKAVKTLVDLSQLSAQNPQQSPTLYVLLLDEKVKADVRGCGPVLQTVVLTFGVVVVAHSGNRTDPDLTPIRQQIRQQLFGWQPHGFEEIALAGGRLLSVQSGYLSWIDQFSTEYTQDANC